VADLTTEERMVRLERRTQTFATVMASLIIFGLGIAVGVAISFLLFATWISQSFNNID
jgi:hypothetical protein